MGDQSLLGPSERTPSGGEDEQGEEQLTPGTAHMAHQCYRAQLHHQMDASASLVAKGKMSLHIPVKVRVLTPSWHWCWPEHWDPASSI